MQRGNKFNSLATFDLCMQIFISGKISQVDLAFSLPSLVKFILMYTVPEFAKRSFSYLAPKIWKTYPLTFDFSPPVHF